ncbi:MAG: TniQ family protein [Marmoricola sp.]
MDQLDRHSYRQVAVCGWAPAHGSQICPRCLAETGAWQTAWRLLLVTACTRHQIFLVARCPGCQRPFRDQHHSHLPRLHTERADHELDARAARSNWTVTPARGPSWPN